LSPSSVPERAGIEDEDEDEYEDDDGDEYGHGGRDGPLEIFFATAAFQSR
jgi:hypothetical protein